MIGRKPTHSFNGLKIGQKAELTGNAATYPYQYINQYQKKGGRKLELIHKDDKLFVKRIA